MSWALTRENFNRWSGETDTEQETQERGSRNSKKLTFQLLRGYKSDNLSPLKFFVDEKGLICAKKIEIKTLQTWSYSPTSLSIVPLEYIFRPFLGSRISFPFFLSHFDRLSTLRSSFCLFFPRPFWGQQVFRRDFSISWNSRRICKVLPPLNHTISSHIHTHS